ncbi:MAG: DUF3093 domain-containing protein [Rothia sp. (in: high G+C Gram-positive bacteria)]|nr:DUF3093 domain-containing protein [Rothia sp. (in: high G+C Gram-positive bacteria)]
MTVPSPRASRDSQLQYREKLTPGVGMWLMVLLAGVATFFVGAPISITAGVIAGIVVALLFGIIMYTSSPVIEITRSYVRVGRAQIEREFVGIAEAFHGEAARVVAGPGLDGRAFMCFRGWIPSKIRIEIADPADPTPYWLASTRHADQIAQIINEGKEDQLALLEEAREQATSKPQR